MDLNFVKQYCVARFNHILSGIDGNAKIALYGAGKHSVFLENALPEAVKRRIAFYMDEDPGKSVFASKPVLHPKIAPWSSIAALVVSSDLYQEELYAKAIAMRSGAAKVEKLYLGLPLAELAKAKSRASEKPPAQAPHPDCALSSFLFSSAAPKEINWQQPFDIMRVAQLLTAVDAARFVSENMGDFRYSSTKQDVLRHAVSQVSVDGLFMEFGVFQGNSLKFIASLTKSAVYGFDSFEGLPDPWGFIMGKGTFSTNGAAPAKLPKNIEIEKGWFEESLPAFLTKHQEPCAFVHIDCDIYSSAKTVLELLRPRLKNGSVIVFDDYFNYIGWEKHIHKAFMEFVEKHSIKYEFMTFASSHCSVAVRIAS